MFNALTFDRNILKRAGSGSCSRVFYAGAGRIDDERVTNFLDVGADFDGELDGNIYLRSVLIGEEIVDRVIDHVLTTKCRVIVGACRTLDEVGTCDKRYGATPVGLAHKFGLLDGAYVAGGTYLDKDDIELINQSGAKIIITPSSSMGAGEGIPPLRMMLTLGADVSIGTGCAEFNPDGDLIFEKKLIALAVSGALCTRDAVAEADLKRMLQ